MNLPSPSGQAAPPGKIMALDVGDARIGVAVCDPLRLTVRPLCTLHRRSRRQDFDALARIYVEEEAVLVVCGLPLNMDGSEGPQGAQGAQLGGAFRARAAWGGGPTTVLG